MKRTCCTVVVVLIASAFFAAGCAPTSAGTSQSESGDQISRPFSGQQFTELFQNADKIGTRKDAFTYDISELIQEYIGTCCTNEESALRLLRSNGFEVHPNRADSGKPDIEQPYDERLVAEKDAERLLYVWKTYRVIIYLNQKHIVAVRAYAFQNGL